MADGTPTDLPSGARGATRKLPTSDSTAVWAMAALLAEVANRSNRDDINRCCFIDLSAPSRTSGIWSSMPQYPGLPASTCPFCNVSVLLQTFGVRNVLIAGVSSLGAESGGRVDRIEKDRELATMLYGAAYVGNERINYGCNVRVFEIHRRLQVQREGVGDLTR